MSHVFFKIYLWDANTFLPQNWKVLVQTSLGENTIFLVYISTRLFLKAHFLIVLGHSIWLWRKTNFTNFLYDVAATAKSLQSCPILCDPIDGSPPGSPVPRILQARTLEWVAVSFSNAGSEKWKWSHSVVSDS